MMPSKMALQAEVQAPLVEALSTHIRRQATLTISQEGALQSRTLLTNFLPSGGQSVNTSRLLSCVIAISVPMTVMARE